MEIITIFKLSQSRTAPALLMATNEAQIIQDIKDALNKLQAS